MSRIEHLEPIRHGVENGIHWKIIFGFNDAFANGYVQIPDNHPFYNLHYDNIDVDIHGGLTYSEDGWIGFDTAHAFDVWTDKELARYGGKHSQTHTPKPDHAYDILWTFDMLEEETKRLARQVDEKDNN